MAIYMHWLFWAGAGEGWLGWLYQNYEQAAKAKQTFENWLNSPTTYNVDLLSLRHGGLHSFALGPANNIARKRQEHWFNSQCLHGSLQPHQRVNCGNSVRSIALAARCTLHGSTCGMTLAPVFETMTLSKTPVGTTDFKWAPQNP